MVGRETERDPGDDGLLGGPVVSAIHEMLAGSPGLTEPEIRKRLSGDAITRYLRAFPEYFACDGSWPPRWILTDPPTSNGESRRVGRIPVIDAQHPLDRPLWRWQAEALRAWNAHGRRGVVEAVTGTGKTQVGIAAAAAELRAGRQVLVLVPTQPLQNQWHDSLSTALSRAKVGRRGNGCYDRIEHCDVLVSVVNSALDGAAGEPRAGGLLIGDECHHYGADRFATALLPSFDHRLGLTATFERNDDGLATHLIPYFGDVCYRLDYARAVADRVTARWKVALVGVEFTRGEQHAYTEADDAARRARAFLINSCDVRAEPFGEFMDAVTSLAAEGVCDPCVQAARTYLSAFTRRRDVLANASQKQAVLGDLRDAILAAGNTLLFTDRVATAERTERLLDGLGVEARSLTGTTSNRERQQILRWFRARPGCALAAARVLDEGIDVPDADLGIIVAASRQRRQMIQRMGRVVRRKSDDRIARFAILFVEGTSEDPATGAHEAFLEQVEALAVERRVFRGDDHRELTAFLEPTFAEPRPPAATNTADPLSAPPGQARAKKKPSNRSSRSPANPRATAAPPPRRSTTALPVAADLLIRLHRAAVSLEQTRVVLGMTANRAQVVSLELTPCHRVSRRGWPRDQQRAVVSPADDDARSPLIDANGDLVVEGQFVTAPTAGRIPATSTTQAVLLGFGLEQPAAFVLTEYKPRRFQCEETSNVPWRDGIVYSVGISVNVRRATNDWLVRARIYSGGPMPTDPNEDLISLEELRAYMADAD
jgi:RNA polymerase primary sigma factor